MEAKSKRRGDKSGRRVEADAEHAKKRRKALKAIGKFGIYTAPALIALLESGRASAY